MVAANHRRSREKDAVIELIRIVELIDETLLFH